MSLNRLRAVLGDTKPAEKVSCRNIYKVSQYMQSGRFVDY